MPQRTNARGREKRRRATPAQSARNRSGRYTEPIPREVRRSPRWYPWVLLGVLIAGVAAIILNYIDLLPASPTNWYTVSGLVAILFVALAATRYR